MEVSSIVINKSEQIQGNSVQFQAKEDSQFVVILSNVPSDVYDSYKTGKEHVITIGPAIN